MLWSMKADQVEVSWDAGKGNWLIRVEVGAEVIRRHADIAKSASEDTLRDTAVQTAADEGYEVQSANVVIRR